MTYAPQWRTALNELASLREGAMQVAQYLAVMSQIRRSMDDWIPAPRFEAFRQIARQLGVMVEVDCVFSPITASEQAFGAQYAPTTSARGRAFSFLETDQFQLHDEVHVVLSTRADWAAETLAAVWYPIVIDNRVVNKPSVDVWRLGRAFGYPACCVRSFMAHNDWPRQNTIAETAKASAHLSWKANCLAKNSPWMLIFHMPCAFDCAGTLAYSSALIEEIRRYDPGVMARIEAYLRQVVLVINERVSFVLGDAIDAGCGRTRYRGVESLRWFFGIEDPLHEPCLAALRRGNEVSIADGIVFVWNDGVLRDAIETGCDRGIAEVPMILDFRT
jgi:hypothetical protein